MNSTHKSIFEAVIGHYLQVKLNRTDFDDCFYKILIKVANFRVEWERRGVTLTKVEAFRAIIAQLNIIESELNSKSKRF